MSFEQYLEDLQSGDAHYVDEARRVLSSLRKENEALKRQIETTLVFAKVDGATVHAYDTENHFFAQIDSFTEGWSIRGNFNDHEYDALVLGPWVKLEDAKDALRAARIRRWNHIRGWN